MAEKDIEFGRRLAAIMERAGFSKKKLAEAIGASPSAVGFYVNEGRIPEAPILLKIAQLLTVSIEDLLTGKSMASKDEQSFAEGKQSGRIVNVYVLAGAGTPKDLVEHDPITTISIPEDFYSASIVPVKIRGRSMEPIIHDGAFIGVDRADRQVVSGEIYAVWMPHEGAIVKRLFIELDKVIIQSDNKDFHSFSVSFKELDNGAYGDDFILGRVKWVIQRL